MKSLPELSVVVVVLEGGSSLESCLASLASQASNDVEIVVPWDPSHGPIPRFGGSDCVRFLPVEGPRTFAELRAFGIKNSRGAIVALTEDHCVPAEDWCRTIISQHQSKHAAIGGAVDKEQPDTPLNWAFYFADYIRYLDPPDSASDHLTDGNVTYKRAALDAIAGLWRVEFHENIIHAALKARNETLWLTPRMLVKQRRRFHLGTAVWDRYAFGRLFGCTRVASADFKTRATLIAASPLTPALLILRAAGHVSRTGRYKGAFLRSLPALTLLSVTWSWGELVGYLTGRPEAVLAAKVREA